MLGLILLILFTHSRPSYTRLGRLDWEMLESSNSSWSTIATSEVSSNSGVFLSSLREETYTSITEVSHVSDDSWTTITTRDIVCSSWECLTTLVDKADMTHASSVQPGLENPSTDLENPSTDLEKQPGPASHPPCNKEVDICLEASSVQQHQGDLNIQLSAPTPPPEEPEVNSREMGMPFHHNKGQETLEGPITESKLKQELGRPANVDEAPQHVPASAPPTPRRQEQHDVSIIPILWNPPFLDMAMKSKLEHHIVKRKIQKHYGLQTRILECEESFASVIWNRKASQPSPLQQYPGLPYHSHFQHWNRNAQKGGHQDSPWTVRRVYTTCRCMPATDGGFSPFWASSIGEENES